MILIRSDSTADMILCVTLGVLCSGVFACDATPVPQEFGDSGVLDGGRIYPGDMARPDDSPDSDSFEDMRSDGFMIPPVEADSGTIDLEDGFDDMEGAADMSSDLTAGEEMGEPVDCSTRAPAEFATWSVTLLDGAGGTRPPGDLLPNSSNPDHAQFRGLAEKIEYTPTQTNPMGRRYTTLLNEDHPSGYEHLEMYHLIQEHPKSPVLHENKTYAFEYGTADVDCALPGHGPSNPPDVLVLRDAQGVLLQARARIALLDGGQTKFPEGFPLSLSSTRWYMTPGCEQQEDEQLRVQATLEFELEGVTHTVRPGHQNIELASGERYTIHSDSLVAANGLMGVCGMWRVNIAPVGKELRTP